MPDPSIAVVGAARTGTATSTDTHTGISFVAGRAYVCVAWQTTTATRTASFDNGGSDTFSALSVENSAVARKAVLGYVVAGSTGSRDVTITWSGSSTFRWAIYEITPGAGDTLALYTTSSFTDGVSDTSHQCAAASGFSPPAQTAVICAMQISTTRTATEGSGYTLLEAGAVNGNGQSKVFSSLSTDEQAAYTLSGNSTTAGAVLGYTSSGAAAGGAGPIFDGRALGAGRIFGGSTL